MVSSHWYEAVIEKFGTVENFIDQLCEMQGLNKEESVSIKQEIDIKQLKIKSIHKDIIRLKQENRNLSAKRKGMIKSIKHWIKREGENFDDTRLRNCMEARIRDLDYVDMLVREKVCYNSVLINKHRSKVRLLKKELSAIKGEK